METEVVTVYDDFTTSRSSATSFINHSTSSGPPYANEVGTHCGDCQVVHDVIFEPFVSALYGALFAFVAVPALICNALVIMTYFRYSHMRTSINSYIVNLAVCDFCLVTLECQPIIVQYVLPTEWSQHVVTDVSCTFFFFFNTFFGTAAIMTLFALSVERFCCVIHPVTTLVLATDTGTRAKFILVLVWCIALLPHFGNCVLFGSVKRELHASSTGNFVYDVTFCVSKKADDNIFFGSFYTACVFVLLYASTFITTLMIYLKIIRKLEKRKIERFENGSVTQRSRSRRGSAHDKARKQTAKLVWISLFSYTVFYSFYFYVNLFYVYFGLFRRQGFTLILIANWFGAVNACINPFLHAVFVSRFRKGISMFLRCRTASSVRTSTEASIGSIRPNSRAMSQLTVAGGGETPTDIALTPMFPLSQFETVMVTPPPE